MLGAVSAADTDQRTAKLSVYHYPTANSAPGVSVASSGTLLSYTGISGKDIISFLYSPATTNPTMNPTAQGVPIGIQNYGVEIPASGLVAFLSYFLFCFAPQYPLCFGLEMGCARLNLHW
jgi:hypothetical protein